IVHCNDWQAGLVPALLSLETNRPATIFTIHNLAYQGLFPASQVDTLNLPGKLWHPDGLEFNHMLSFIKGGLAFADRITTVSPTYAAEIQTPAFGYGLEGLLQYRANALTGIINGIDTELWGAETDKYIKKTFTVTRLVDKKINKAELQQRFGLPAEERIPMFALISRLVEQKGIDLLLDCLPEMMAMKLQLVLLGAGDKVFEQRLQAVAEAHPDKFALTLGYDEALAHQIEAGADIFLMPSKFEPCGLNQMYSQRYGTIPIVRKTGGLADTVVDATLENVADKTASGIVFGDISSGSLMEAIKRVLWIYQDQKVWAQMQATAMKKDFSWRNSAEQYLRLYDEL
ncbi:glycogen synthase GlgA, partial [Methylocucumis oryzae]